MKKILYSLAILFYACSAFAAVRTVSNVPSTLAQFNTIQAAIDASANGDTVYVHGSPNQYAFFTVADKRVTIIGPGWSPDKNMPLQVIVQGAALQNNLAAGDVAGSEIQGLIFTSNVEVAGSNAGLPTSNIRVIRCQFNSTVSVSTGSTGFLFEGNIFYTSMNFNGGATYTNFLFQNNLIYAGVCCTGASFNSLTNCVNVRFDHNLFYGDGPVVFGSNCRFLTITNNIFSKRNAAANLSFSTFNNNITFNCGPTGDTAWIRNSNVDAGGNIAAQSPQMADQSLVDAGNTSPLLNLTIAAGPANNAGSDGKDIGMLFDAVGTLNWTNSRNSRLPRIFSMNIINPTIAPGGTLNVAIDARKSN